jgi:FKBP-type peptidyl-prolyl cis-trans isomerase 2
MPILTGSTVTINLKFFSEANQLLYENEEPLTFTLGDDEIPVTLEKNLHGLEVGAMHRFTLLPEDWFGPYNKDLVFTLSRKQLEGDSEDILPGQSLTLYTPEGQILTVSVLSVTDGTIEVDANHPLAGETLVCEVEVLSIE